MAIYVMYGLRLFIKNYIVDRIILRSELEFFITSPSFVALHS